MCSQSLNKPDYRCLIGQTLKINVTHTHTKLGGLTIRLSCGKKRKTNKTLKDHLLAQ